MKKLLSILILALALTLAVGAETLDGTLVRPKTADPNLFFYNGKYYMTQTGSGRIAVFEKDTLAELAKTAENSVINANIEYDSGDDDTVAELFGVGASINGTWSPEIHYISADMFGEQYEGWYMFLGLRQETGNSSMVRNVVLKSMTDSPKGPYGHPKSGLENQSEPLRDDDGTIHDEWACGQTLLTIPEGPYKGVYTMWVSEVGRETGLGGINGDFYQKIMIAKMKSPWQIDGTPGIVTTPTQEWEYAGASTTHPRVVEGATPVYGKNGEVFITYSGSGYWSDYGLGQLTWNGGDPLETSSWVKLPVENGNPIFTATTATNVRGAGHASFLTDMDGNGFFCYHAYAYNEETGKKASSRDAYIEPYSIDYTKWNGVSYGVIQLGLNGNGVAADTASSVYFEAVGEHLTTPEVYALGRTFSITLTMLEANAEGFIIYKSEDGEVFDYLTSAVGTRYVDTAVTTGETYYYRVYPYRNEEVGAASEIASTTASTRAPYTESATANGNTITVTVHAQDNYETVRLYRSEDGTHFGTGIQEINNVQYGETLTFTDTITTAGTYTYMASGISYGTESLPAGTVSVTVEITPPTISSIKQTTSGSVRIEVTAGDDYDGGINIYHSADGEAFTLNTRASGNHAVSGGGRLFTTVSRLDAGTHYFYATGVANGVESAPSDTVSFDVVEVKAPVITVTTTCEAITLTWSGDEEYSAYTIYRGVLTTDAYLGEYYEYTEIATTAESTYTLTGVTVGEEYCLGVRGTAGGINSAISIAPVQTPAHTTVEVEELAPTCTESGYTAYTYCAYCDTVLSGKEPISATDHTYEMTEAEIPATTESTGKTAVYTCSACGDSYGGEVIPMLREAGNGDANGDGKVDLLDILRILKYAVNPDVSIQKENADLDANGSITIVDVLLALKAILTR